MYLGGGLAELLVLLQVYFSSGGKCFLPFFSERSLYCLFSNLAALTHLFLTSS